MKTTKNILLLSVVVLLLLGASNAMAQGNSAAAARNGQGIVDANGDGICNITGKEIGSGAGNTQGQQARRDNTNGPGDGTGNLGARPKDGTGYGAQSGKRTGPQDGSQSRIHRGNSMGSANPAAGGRARRGGRQ